MDGMNSAANVVVIAVSAGDAAADGGDYSDIDMTFDADGYAHKDGRRYPPRDV